MIDLVIRINTEVIDRLSSKWRLPYRATIYPHDYDGLGIGREVRHLARVDVRHVPRQQTADNRAPTHDHPDHCPILCGGYWALIITHIIENENNKLFANWDNE